MDQHPSICYSGTSHPSAPAESPASYLPKSGIPLHSSSENPSNPPRHPDIAPERGDSSQGHPLAQGPSAPVPRPIVRSHGSGGPLLQGIPFIWISGGGAASPPYFPRSCDPPCTHSDAPSLIGDGPSAMVGLMVSAGRTGFLRASIGAPPQPGAHRRGGGRAADAIPRLQPRPCVVWTSPGKEKRGRRRCRPLLGLRIGDARATRTLQPEAPEAEIGAGSASRTRAGLSRDAPVAGPIRSEAMEAGPRACAVARLGLPRVCACACSPRPEKHASSVRKKKGGGGDSGRSMRTRSPWPSRWGGGRR